MSALTWQSTFCGEEPPSDHDRRYAMDITPAQIDFAEYEDDEWSERYRLNGLQVDISGFLTRNVRQYIGLLLRLESAFGTDPEQGLGIFQSRAFETSEMIREEWPDLVKKFLAITNR